MVLGTVPNNIERTLQELVRCMISAARLIYIKRMPDNRQWQTKWLNHGKTSKLHKQRITLRVTIEMTSILTIL